MTGVNPSARTVAVALGSNLGDCGAHLAFAVARLERVLTDVRVSGFVYTDPEHGVDDPRFLNGALVGTWTTSPEALLSTLLGIERERGRVRSRVGAPRPLDLDLLLVGDLIVDSEVLQLPHPRFRSRRFVLGPLSEIAPGLVDPVTGKTVSELLRLLSGNIGGSRFKVC